MSKFLDKALAPFARMIKQPLESFIRLETADDSVTLVAEDGSLVSMFQIDGARQIIGAAEYERIVEQGVIKLGARFDRAGYALQAVFIRNPVSGFTSPLKEALVWVLPEKPNFSQFDKYNDFTKEQFEVCSPASFASTLAV